MEYLTIDKVLPTDIFFQFKFFQYIMVFSFCRFYKLAQSVFAFRNSGVCIWFGSLTDSLGLCANVICFKSVESVCKLSYCSSRSLMADAISKHFLDDEIFKHAGKVLRVRCFCGGCWMLVYRSVGLGGFRYTLSIILSSLCIFNNP